MNIGRSIPDVRPDKWYFIAHETKKGRFYNITAGVTYITYGERKTYFVDLNDIDIIQVYRWGIRINWKYIFSFHWLRGA